MSTIHSVGRSASTRENDRSAATKANHRPAVTYDNGCPALTPKVNRSAAAHKKNRSTGLCAFAFADGRQCRMPRCSGHLHLCYFHAQKEAESLAAQHVGEDISRFLPTKLLTACDLGVALSRTFCAVAQGQIKPKVATTLAYLAQTMLQSIPIAQHEYCEAFSSDSWRRTIRSSFAPPTPQPQPAPNPAPRTASPAPQAPSPQPGSSASPSTSPAAPQPPVNCHSDVVAQAFRPEESASSSNSSLATHHSPLPPAPSPHTPLPPTSFQFAQQVLARRNSSRSEIPTPSGPGREPGSSASTPSPAPQPPVNCHSERSEEPAAASSSSNSSLATHHSPPPQAPQPAPTPPAPPPVPPGFGAPANWDVLLFPKPRRRFSRHWHLLE